MVLKKNRSIKIKILLLFVLFVNSVFSQSIMQENKTKSVAPEYKIKWYTFEEASVEYQKSAKPFFIDLYTDWCGWCKKMDASTFQDPIIANYLNTFFYPVKFNAESKDTVNVFGKKVWNSQDAYVARFFKTSDSTLKILNDSILWINEKKKEKYSERLPGLNAKIEAINLEKGQMQRQASRTSHDLARDLMNNQMSYPTFVFLFDSLRQNFPVKGFQQPAQLLSLMTFVNEGVYKTTSDVTTYQNLFYQNVNTEDAVENSVKWKAPTELSKSNTSGKKTLLLITSDNYFSSLVLERGTFNDEQVAFYVNKEFNPVLFKLNYGQNINFKGVEYKNLNGIHELPLLLLQNEVQFPSLLILDENHNVITRIPGFYPPMEMEIILAFFKEDAFKTKNYAEFKQEFEARTK